MLNAFAPSVILLDMGPNQIEETILFCFVEERIQRDTVERLAAETVWQLSREDLLEGMQDYDSGSVSHGFVESTTYDLIYQNRQYPPKAVVGLALAKYLRRVPEPVELRGGAGTTTFLLLRARGFHVIKKTRAYPDELSGSDSLVEGAGIRVVVNRYERNRAARAACIAEYGTTCHVCDIDFAQVYPGIGDGFIHVHHLTPLSEIGHKYEVDPITDLIPVCPNCHAMLHRGHPVSFTPEEVREIVRS